MWDQGFGESRETKSEDYGVMLKRSTRIWHKYCDLVKCNVRSMSTMTVSRTRHIILSTSEFPFCGWVILLMNENFSELVRHSRIEQSPNLKTPMR